ncbi:hypothetical protein [Mycolicibacterium sp. P1-5]|uniref:hypothetical protein n=1 Tax=Mycolicibacterium sp. P1-5 TaxID=2024617 RepID=UPI0011ECAAD8|nr:hypothetical protein [Mycolicibacterium sp. P1-5]KAA0108644.1 hypothetical protein CIW47_13830 [Mycolicibacterium sp. P1-5]
MRDRVRASLSGGLAATMTIANPFPNSALAADKPTVLDVRCGHRTGQGEPDRWHMMTQGAKAKAHKFLPHREG